MSSAKSAKTYRRAGTWLSTLRSASFRGEMLDLLGGRVSFSAKAIAIAAASIFILSFSIRSLAAADLYPVMYSRAQPGGGMSAEYSSDAVSMLSGEGVLFRENPNLEDTRMLSRPPGYPAFLAAIFSISGESYFAVQIFQNALTSLGPVIIMLIAGNLITWPVGVAAGLMAAFSHHLSYYSNLVLPDAICALPILLAFYLVVVSKARRFIWAHAVAGALIGASVWLRPNPLMLGLFISILLPLVSVRRLQVAKKAWAIAIATFAVVAPITIRNYVTYGEFVPVSINTGIVLWEGIADAGGEHFGAVRKDLQVAVQEAIFYDDDRYMSSWATPDGIKRDRDRVARSLDVIINNPVWFARAMTWRMGQMFKYSAGAPLIKQSGDAAITDSSAQSIIEDRYDGQSASTARPSPASDSLAPALITIGTLLDWVRPAARAIQRAIKESLLLLIILGAVATFILSPRRALILWIVPAYYLLSQSIMHYEFRYIMPMHYFVLVFAAVFWVLLFSFAYRMAKRLMPARKQPASEVGI
jgi:hypothetical protein